MGQLVVTNFTRIDGVIQSPLSAEEDPSAGFAQGGWVVPYSDDSVADFMRRATVAAEGLLLGGRTYAILAEAWSAADESEPAVAAMNRMPKYVVSRSAETSIVQVRNHNDAGVRMTNGSFMRSDLPVAGFAVIEAENAEEAARLVSATPCSVAHGVVEVWPLQSTP